MVGIQGEQVTLRRVDIAVFDSVGQLQLIVEVKNRSGATTEWAMQMRRNLTAHLNMPAAPFFLLALPDHFYLWHGAADSLDLVPADYAIDPTPLLAPYISDTYRLPNTLSESGLMLAVSAWLNDIISADLHRATAPPEHTWLFDSGLYPRIRGGSLAAELSI